MTRQGQMRFTYCCPDRFVKFYKKIKAGIRRSKGTILYLDEVIVPILSGFRFSPKCKLNHCPERHMTRVTIVYEVPTRREQRRKK